MVRRRSGGSIDFGRRLAILRVGSGVPSGRVDIRAVIVIALLLVAAVAVSLVALGTGGFSISPARVVGVLFGEGSRNERMVVLDWRMPRILMALLLGAAFGLSGAIFQSLTRNPLGSPDIIGFNTGAYTGALVVMLVLGTGGAYPVAIGALGGGVATALLVYFLAFKRGVQGFRLIIVGIAVSAILTGVNTWLLLKADLDSAMYAAAWGAGTLNGIGWAQTTPVVIILGALVIPVALIARFMPILEMGDDAAKALGVRAEPTRLAMIVGGVALTAVGTAAAGPIAFISLAAPQLARRLTRTAGVALLPSAAMGAFLLAGSDLLAQTAFSGRLPVGVMTVSIGGMYLIWLLAHEARRQ
ncbi:iron chelate uptake ABC transporter family permease subunit [Millisia brevis]|uniref:FecCD family ABC transporter permease n=1 Tax=Millisia brevis TaxID=264148 RepID=UPI00082EC525